MLSSLRVAAPQLSRRSYASLASKDGYKVVIVGGGAAGVTVAAKLSSSPGFSGAKDICIVEPSSTHYYQPLWTLVGGGVKSFTESARPEGDVIPHGVRIPDLDAYFFGKLKLDGHGILTGCDMFSICLCRRNGSKPASPESTPSPRPCRLTMASRWVDLGTCL